MDNGKEVKFDLDELNLDTNDMSWDNDSSRTSRSLGNKALAPNQPVDQPRGPETTNKSEIAPSMPPGYETQIEQAATNIQSESGLNPDIIATDISKETSTLVSDNPGLIAPTIDHSVIKTEEKLDPRAVEIVDKAINKLDQDGDIASFYDTARNLVETNLKNSYNRKLGA